MKYLTLAVPALAAATSPVQKVIELIGELKGKVQNDLNNESKAMGEYSTFCDDESTQKGFAIKTAAREIDGYKAAIEDTDGQIQSLASTIETAGSSAAAKTEELNSATNVRNNENADFKAAEKELVDAVDTLGRAVVIIKREMSFAQGASKGQVQKKLNDLSGAMQSIISAAWLDTASRSKLQAFMETDEDLSLHQPQASSYNYESHSGGIVSTLDDMKDKAESALNNLRREETKSRHAFELIKQSLNDAVTGLNKEIDEASAQKAAAEERLAKAQGDLSTTSASKKADEEYKAKLESDCAAKAAEWSERQKSAKAEMDALAKGQEVLSAKFSFIQSAVKVHVHSSNEDSVELRANLGSLLKKLGRENNSFALMQIANAAKSDPFVKVRGLIESMVAKLEQQASEEASHEAFCQEEMAKSTKTKERKMAKADKTQARIDEAKAGHAELKNEVAQLSEEIAQIEDSQRKATNMRTSQNAEYKHASTDYRESAEAVTQALVVLKEFYHGGAALIQQPSFQGAKSEGSHMIIEILEVAQSDFSRLLAEAETSESEAVEAYKALSQANRVAKATKEASVKAKTSEMKSIEVALTHHSEDLSTVNTELDAVMEYLSKLKPQCESRGMSYEERKSRREAEMAGLQEALSLLSGDSAALIQTKGFLQ